MLSIHEEWLEYRRKVLSELNGEEHEFLLAHLRRAFFGGFSICLSHATTLPAETPEEEAESCKQLTAWHDQMMAFAVLCMAGKDVLIDDFAADPLHKV